MSQIFQTAFLRILRSYRGSTAMFNAYRTQSTASTEITQASQTQGKHQDALMETLKCLPSQQELLNAVSRYSRVMSNKHLLQVLRSLFHLQKESRSNYDNNNLIRDPTFGSLCQALKRNARSLEPNEFIEALKILSYLRVPIDSLIQQTMLQLVRTNINNFNIRQIMFIDFLISKYDESNPLVDALRLALPLVFQIHLPLELDHEDLPLMKEMLLYACTRNLPDRCINNIVTGILLHGQSIDYQTARSIIWSLAEINVTAELYSTRVKLLHVCLEILANSINKLPYDDVHKLTAKLKGRILERHMEFYHVGLFDAIAEYVVCNSLNFDKSVLIARILCKIAHTNMELVEYVCRLAHSELPALARARPNMLFGFVNCLSNANYAPERAEWDAIRHHISQNSVLEIKNVALPWTKFGLELASLGHYDVKFLTKLFSEEVMSTYLSREESTLDYIQILMLHEAAKTFCVEYKASPPEWVLERARQLYPTRVAVPELETALARGLGGEQYYASNIQLPNGIVADHIVALQSGGYPIPLQGASEGKTSLQQLNLPQSALIICIIKFNKGCYSLNADRLRGNFRLLVDVLERQGFPVVPVCLHTLFDAPDSERTPYLMREVTLKCREVGMELSVVV